MSCSIITRYANFIDDFTYQILKSIVAQGMLCKCRNFYLATSHFLHGYTLRYIVIAFSTSFT